MAGNVAGAEIRVDGLKDLRRRMREFVPEAATLLTGEIRKTSLLVRDMAVYEAAERGFHDTGDLLAGLKAGAAGISGYVKDTAEHGGYGYPGRLEFEHGGEHAFIRPAIAAGRPVILARMEAAVEAAVTRFNEGDL